MHNWSEIACNWEVEDSPLYLIVIIIIIIFILFLLLRVYYCHYYYFLVFFRPSVLDSQRYKILSKV